MTMPPPSADRRAELVAAAARLLHQQGFHQTTLAQVAEAVAIPLGNVYDYFKTKEALAEAVLAAHEAALVACFGSWELAHADPRERLRRLLLAPLDASDSVIRFGCPHGSLCQELEKLGAGAPLARAAERLLGAYVTWATEQYRALGAGRDARAMALDLVAHLQGTMLLAHTLRAPDVLEAQLRRAEARLLDVPRPTDAAAASSAVVAAPRAAGTR